jgi:hypothetical protein
LAAFAFALTVAVPAGAITIDAFDDPTGGHAAFVQNGAAGASDDDTAIGLAATGGSRDLEVTIQTSANDAANSARAEVNGLTTTGVFELNSSAAVDTVATLTWDAQDAGLDLDLAGDTVLRLEGVLNDLATDFTFTLETFGGGSVSCTTSTGAQFAGDVSCDFAGLFNGVAANNIDRITITIDPVGRGGDVQVDRLVTIPEPATALLLGLGSSGLAWLGSRRRSARG